MTHTPGPWTTKPETNYCAAQVWADGQLLADVFGESRDARKANASLMASAPELLEACKLMIVSHPGNVMLQRAIAKAEGKS